MILINKYLANNSQISIFVRNSVRIKILQSVLSSLIDDPNIFKERKPRVVPETLPNKGFIVKNKNGQGYQVAYVDPQIIENADGDLDSFAWALSPHIHGQAWLECYVPPINNETANVWVAIHDNKITLCRSQRNA